jgi:hypothetical protein
MQEFPPKKRIKRQQLIRPPLLSLVKLDPRHLRAKRRMRRYLHLLIKSLLLTLRQLKNQSSVSRM